jgi:hypothetical protein
MRKQLRWRITRIRGNRAELLGVVNRHGASDIANRPDGDRHLLSGSSFFGWVGLPPLNSRLMWLRPRRRRLVNEIGLAVPLGLGGEVVPGTGHHQQEWPLCQIGRFLSQAHAINAVAPVLYCLVHVPPSPTWRTQIRTYLLIKFGRVPINGQTNVRFRGQT